MLVFIDVGVIGEVFCNKVVYWFVVFIYFKFELILFFVGFDVYVEDFMVYLCLIEDDYYWLSVEFKKVVDICCEGCIVSVLEGGYDMSVLGCSVVVYLKGLVY